MSVFLKHFHVSKLYLGRVLEVNVLSHFPPLWYLTLKAHLQPAAACSVLGDNESLSWKLPHYLLKISISMAASLPPLHTCIPAGDTALSRLFLSASSFHLSSASSAPCFYVGLSSLQTTGLSKTKRT